MAQPAPASKTLGVDQFGFIKLRKLELFPSAQPVTGYCQLVATASQYGLVFTGSSSPELKVILTQRIADKEQQKLIRTVPLPSVATQIAVSCDGSFLAVEIQINNTPFLSIYSVPSFLSAQPQIIDNIRVCPEEFVMCRQLAWNPVIPGCLAVCLANGGMSMYTLKGNGFEFHSLAKQNAVQSICWSPKGKQIVAGQLGFKLVQYKPDLSMARTIPCPCDPRWTTAGPCSVLSIQWLSTYQFAVAVLPSGGDSPELHLMIVNAPKNNQIALVDYGDPCFSEAGPRQPQMLFVHIHDWNMLLVASANSPDVSLLATAETGDAPTWVQYEQETESAIIVPQVKGRGGLPIGLALDTTGLVEAKREVDADDVQQLRPRPTVHLLSNCGELVVYAAVNKLPNFKEICTQPNQVGDHSGLSEFVEQQVGDDGASPVRAQPNVTPPQQAPAATASVQQPAKDPEMTFANFGAASTPIVQQKAASVFGGMSTAASGAFAVPPATSGGLFGSSVPASTAAAPVGLAFGQKQMQSPQQSQQPVPTNLTTVKPTATLFFPKPEVAPQMPASTPPSNTAQSSVQSKQPLISVPPKFSSPTVTTKTSTAPSTGGGNVTNQLTDDEDREVAAEMIREDISTMDKEIADLIARCRSINVSMGSKEEMQTIMKDLSALTDFSQQAVDTSDQLMSEVRMLNLSLNEAFFTTKTANEFFALYKNPEAARPRDYMAPNPANRRKLMRLETALLNNEQQLNFIQRQLMAHYAEHEQVRNQYNKDRMHIPCLEGVYETLTRQKEILFRERQKINYLTSLLGVRLLSREEQQDQQQVDSMADSMLSMSINDSTLNNLGQKRVDAQKMQQLTAYLANRPVTVISPARPRNGLNSEVIMARKEKIIKAKKQQQQQQQQQGVKKLENTSQMVKTKTTLITEIAAPQMQKPQQVPVKDVIAPVAKPPPSLITIQKPVATAATTGPKSSINFGGFGDSSATTTTGMFGNLSAPKMAETKGMENVEPPPANRFGGFTGAAAATVPAKKEDVPVVAPAPAFSFNVPKATPAPTPIVSSSSSTSGGEKEKTIFGGGGSSGGIAGITSTFSLPSSITITAIPSTTTATANKPIFGGLSSGPISFGGASEQKTTTAINEKEVLDNLKICSPATTTTTATSSVDAQKNIFSSTAFGSLLGSSISTTTATPSSATPSTVIAPTVTPPQPPLEKVEKTTAPTATAITSSAPSIFAGFGSTAISSAPSASTVPATAASTSTPGGSFFGAGFGGGAATGSIFGATTAAATTTTPPSTGEGIKSLFGSLSNTTSVAPAPVDDKPAVITTSPLPKPDQSVFGQQSMQDAIPVSTTSTSSAAASSFSFGNLGLGPPATTTNTTNAAQSQSPFGMTATATPPATGFGGAGGSIFGGGGTGSTFGAPASNGSSGTGSIFGGGGATSPAASGGSIFGGTASSGNVFGGGGGQAQTGGSMFGGGGQATSPFGAPAAASPGNVFGSPTATNQTTGGSIFGGGSAFGGGQSTGSMFGGGANTAASPASSGFSFASASAAPAFGSPAAAAPGNSPFGGGAVQQAPAFGQPQSPFGGGGGGGGAFGKPQAFGSPPAFGSPATFGGPPVFGGGASFGGGFGTPAATGPPTQQNNLFAALGSSDNSLSFGNLAQSNAMQQPQAGFGGSAFSSWR